MGKDAMRAVAPFWIGDWRERRFAIAKLESGSVSPGMSSLQKQGDDMEISVEHLGAVQFEIKTRGHSIVSDQPSSAGGYDEGMTPPELLLASLGSCAGYYAAEYLRKHKLASEGTTVRVSCEKVSKPVARMTDFVIEVNAPKELSEEHLRGMEQAVEHCLVHNTLLNPPKIRVKVAGPAVLADK